MKHSLTLLELDTLMQATKDYLAATVTKCDSPQIREARSTLVKACIPIDVEILVAKAVVGIDIEVGKTVV